MRGDNAAVVDREPPETVAAVRCFECGRDVQPGELWRLFFADVGEVAACCPNCAEREFGED